MWALDPGSESGGGIVSHRQSDSPRPTGRGEATRCHLPLASTKLTFLGSVAVPAIRGLAGRPLDCLFLPVLRFCSFDLS